MRPKGEARKFPHDYWPSARFGKKVRNENRERPKTCATGDQ